MKSRGWLRRLVGVIINPSVLAFVKWSIRDEPFDRKDMLGSRLVSVLQAELDQRAPAVVAARVKLEADERKAAERDRRAEALQEFQSLNPFKGINLQ
jgi:hypothetical protein